MIYIYICVCVYNVNIYNTENEYKFEEVAPSM